MSLIREDAVTACPGHRVFCGLLHAAQSQTCIFYCYLVFFWFKILIWYSSHILVSCQCLPWTESYWTPKGQGVYWQELYKRASSGTGQHGERPRMDRDRQMKNNQQNWILVSCAMPIAFNYNLKDFIAGKWQSWYLCPVILHLCLHSVLMNPRFCLELLEANLVFSSAGLESDKTCIWH